MKTLLIFLAFLMASLLVPNSAYADAPTCHTHTDNRPYCNYTGYVKNLYVNSENLILIYFDTPLDVTKATAAGFTGTISPSAVAVKMDENPDFAKLFYSTALSAQAQKKKVTLQMWGRHSVYLKADRIWLADQ